MFCQLIDTLFPIRSSTTDMAAFNYGKNVLMDQEREVLQDVETLVGVRR